MSSRSDIVTSTPSRDRVKKTGTQSAPDRPLPIAMRQDLLVVDQTFRGSPSFVLSDPVTLRQYCLNAQEFAILTWLDGTCSASLIQRRFHDVFAPHRIELREIEACLIQFHEKNLLENIDQSLGTELFRRSKKKSYRDAFHRIANPLSIRLPGWDPQFFLERLTRWTGFLFSLPAVCVSFVFFLISGLWFTIHSSEFYARMPALGEFFSTRNWLGLALVAAIVKLLHELGHGIAASRFGIRCHELGVSLMMFMPTLYINTTNAWRLKSKWQRMEIAAAGIYVEFLLCSLATWTWWYCEAGIIQYVALNVMVLCSVSTLFLNANPLMKYDGYFILSDYLEIPNLQQRANQYFRDWFAHFGFGVREWSESSSDPRTRSILLAYAISSYAFRFAVLSGIAWVLCLHGRWVGLEAVARCFVVFSFAILLAGPVIGMVRYFSSSRRRRRIRPGRLKFFMAITVILMSLFFLVPLPTVLVCECTLEPRDYEIVYAEKDSVLESVGVRPGEWGEAGQTVAVLRSLDLDLELERVRGDVSELEAREKLLSITDQRYVAGNRERDTVRARLATKREAQRELEAQVARLNLRSEKSGWIQSAWIAPRPESSIEGLGGRESWSLPVAFERPVYRRGDEVFRVVDWTGVRARVVIPQGDISRVRLGQSVRLISDSLPDMVMYGEIAAIAEQKIDKLDPSTTLSQGGMVEGEVRVEEDWKSQGSDGSMVPRRPTFEAIVSIRDFPKSIRPGHHGVAKISIPWESGCRQLYRFVARQFHFEW